MNKEDYDIGDMVRFSYYGGDSKLDWIGIVIEKIVRTQPNLRGYGGYFPCYVVMEPGGKQSTVSHRRMELIKTRGQK